MGMSKRNHKVDFGLCVDISDGKKSSMVGSPHWMPPEMIQRKSHDFKVTQPGVTRK
jgi:serine/threonine protein kinase